MVHNNGRSQCKASLVDFIAPTHVGDNTEYSTIKVRDSIVSKHKRSQLHVDQINNQDVVLLDRGYFTLDLVNKCRNLTRRIK